MNALIALAVWCQPHGPVTILTTQHRRPTSSSLCNGKRPVKDSSTQPSTSTSNSSSNGHLDAGNDTPHKSPSVPQQNEAHSKDSVSAAQPPKDISSSNSSLDTQARPTSASPPTSTTDTTATTATSVSSNSHTLEPKKSRRSLHQQSPSTNSGPSPVGGRPSSAHPALSPPSNASSNSCECQFSVPSGEKSLHSVDPFNKELSYISQPAPVDASLFAPIRIACIRSLNSETYCGREGSVFFGDGMNGYVLSYMFTVYDAQSRGHRVKYTIMTMMTDRVYLVASMEYLISQFQVIASNLQSMANALCSQQPSPATRSFSFSSSHHRGSIMPENAPTKRGRPLTDVLAKPDIFVQLHAAFVSVLSNCSRRLTERHVQGRPNSECLLHERSQEQQQQESQGSSTETGDQVSLINSLRDLRRALGQQPFNRLVWNGVVGNQVIVRGEDTKIVHEIIRSLEDVLPKDCCTIITDGSSYEPSYACNILGLDRSIPIPPDLDPQDFILLDICPIDPDNQIPTPPISLPTENKLKIGTTTTTTSPGYQADWSSATLVADMEALSTQMENTTAADGKLLDGQADGTRLPTSLPTEDSSLHNNSDDMRQRYLLQAGEEPPEALEPPGFGDMNGLDALGKRMHQQSPPSPLLQHQHQQQQQQQGVCALYIETVNEILDLKMPRAIESKRLALLREEWISKSIQFHNLYKAGKASNEAVVERFLRSLRVDRRDLKILRFFTRCAKSSTFQAQKYRSEDPIAVAVNQQQQQQQQQEQQQQ